MKEVLSALKARPMTPAILERTLGVEQEVLGEMVTALIVQDLIEEQGNKLYLTAQGEKFLAASEQPAAQNDLAALMELDDEVIELDIPEQVEMPVPHEIDAALEKLSASLNWKINNLPTKLAVLERLSEILDPSIAMVLAEIQRDLKVAA